MAWASKLTWPPGAENPSYATVSRPHFLHLTLHIFWADPGHLGTSIIIIIILFVSRRGVLRSL